MSCSPWPGVLGGGPHEALDSPHAHLLFSQQNMPSASSAETPRWVTGQRLALGGGPPTKRITITLAHGSTGQQVCVRAVSGLLQETRLQGNSRLPRWVPHWGPLPLPTFGQHHLSHISPSALARSRVAFQNQTGEVFSLAGTSACRNGQAGQFGHGGRCFGLRLTQPTAAWTWPKPFHSGKLLLRGSNRGPRLPRPTVYVCVEEQ